MVSEKPRPTSTRATASTWTARESFFEAIRKANYKPRVVFTSSIAVFGAPFPEAIGDEFLNAPLTSYGTQKAIGELLLSDYSRRGFFDGIGLRLPTICAAGQAEQGCLGVFPWHHSRAARRAGGRLPRTETVRHWFASPRHDLLHAASSTRQFGAAQSQHAGRERHGRRADRGAAQGRRGETAGLIRREPDATIMRIVEGWPRNFDTRARLLGFRADAAFEDIIRIHIEDEVRCPHTQPGRG